MHKYYKKIENKSVLTLASGSGCLVPVGFGDLSSLIIRRCSFLQVLIQKIIYVTHGADLFSTKQVLGGIPNPKSRMEFLSSFPYSDSDKEEFRRAFFVFQGTSHLFDACRHSSEKVLVETTKQKTIKG